MAGLTLTIAGVRLQIRSPHPLLPAAADSPYEPFVGEESSPLTTIDVAISLELANATNTACMTPLFRDPSWSMFHDDGFYYLQFHAPTFGGPMWLARFDHRATQVTVFCGPQLVQHTDSGLAILNPVHYPLDQILLTHVLAQRGGLLLHAAGATISGRGLAFPGQSSAGKSTLSELLLRQPGMVVLSDDRVVVRQMDGQFHMFGTPWPGHAGAARNESAPLTALLFLCQGPHNSVQPITARAALEKLLPVTSILWYNRQLLDPMLAFCEALVTQVPAFALHFTPDMAAVDFLQQWASRQPSPT